MIERNYGQLDILVNNAGVEKEGVDGRYQPVGDTPGFARAIAAVIGV